MAHIAAHRQALRLLERALAAGAIVELAGRALVLVTEAGPVVPRDRTGTWPGFKAPGPGIYACCPLWHGVPMGIVSPGCRAWLRLGEIDELPELLPVAEWFATMTEGGAHAFAVGLLHGLGRIAEATPAEGPARPLIRAPDSLARELFG